MAHDRIINQHQPSIALYPRNLSYDLLPLIGPAGWSLLRALHDHTDEQANLYRGARPIAPSTVEMEALAGVGEASLLVVKELLRVCGCLSWEEVRGKQEPRPGRKLKQAPTRTLVYYLHPLTGLKVTPQLVETVFDYLEQSERAQAYLKSNGLLRSRPAYLPTSVWPTLLPWMVEHPRWQALFQRLHGRGAHHAYCVEAHRWLESAAEVVATLEWEQQPLQDRERLSVADRAVMVMARWGVHATVPSWRGHGPFSENHGDPALTPHTPLNKLINKPINESGGPGGRGTEGQRSRETTGGNWKQSAVDMVGLPALQPEDPAAQADAARWASGPHAGSQAAQADAARRASGSPSGSRAAQADAARRASDSQPGSRAAQADAARRASDSQPGSRAAQADAARPVSVAAVVGCADVVATRAGERGDVRAEVAVLPDLQSGNPAAQADAARRVSGPHARSQAAQADAARWASGSPSGSRAAQADAARRASELQPGSPEAQADAAFWAAVAAVVGCADAVAPRAGETGTATNVCSYTPSRSEDRLARRLLRSYTPAEVLAALRTAIATYRPAPGQPLLITRFGFATGLPGFKAALDAGAENLLSPPAQTPIPVDAAPTCSPAVQGMPPSPHPTVGVPPCPSGIGDDAETDFWHEYTRVNDRDATRAERRRIATVAVTSGWSQLLTWLDRWEAAHMGSEGTIGPAYFETCAAAEQRKGDTQPETAAPPGARRTPGGVAGEQAAAEPGKAVTLPLPMEWEEDGALPAAQQRSLDRLVELGIRTAQKLASLPTTTPELIEAWWQAACNRPRLKDKGGFIAAGVGSGEYPMPAHERNSSRMDVARHVAQGTAALPGIASPPPATACPAPQSPAHVELWQKVLGRLRAAVAPEAFATWLAPTVLLDIIGGIVVVGTPNVFVRDQIESAYLGPMTAALTEELARPVEVEIVIGSAAPV